MALNVARWKALEFDEPPLLHDPDLMLCVLRSARSGDSDVESAIAELCGWLRAAGEPAPSELGPIRTRFEGCIRNLSRAGLVETGPGQRIRLTDRGHEVLAAHPGGIDHSVLMQFDEFREFVAGHHAHEHAADPCPAQCSDGYEAYKAGWAQSDNPHPFDSIAHLAWENGWSEARDDERH